MTIRHDSIIDVSNEHIRMTVKYLSLFACQTMGKGEQVHLS